MRHIWQVLELDPFGVDEKKVRQAYARLLKVYRPDQDPEGFQRLRSAYEQALNWLKWQHKDEDDNEDEKVGMQPDTSSESPILEWSVEKPAEQVKASKPAPTPPLKPSWGDGDAPELPTDAADTQGEPAEPVKADLPAPAPPLRPSWGDGDAPELPAAAAGTPDEPLKKPPDKQRPERNWPRSWSFGIEALERACQRSEEEPEGVSKALTAFAWDVREHGISDRAMETILRDVFDGRMDLLARSLSPAILAELLSQGSMWLLDELWSLLQPGTRVHFAQKLEHCPQDIFHAGNAAFLIRVACFVALESPKAAQNLNVLLYRLPKGTVSQEEKDRLRVLIHRGMVFLKLPSDARAFWNHRIAHPDIPCDWSQPQVKDVLEQTVVLGPEWPGLDYIQKVVPPEILQKASSSLLPRKIKRALRGMMTRDFLTTTGFSAVAGVLLFFGAMKLHQMRDEHLAREAERKKAGKQQADRQKEQFIRKIRTMNDTANAPK